MYRNSPFFVMIFYHQSIFCPSTSIHQDAIGISYLQIFESNVIHEILYNAIKVIMPNFAPFMNMAASKDLFVPIIFILFAVSLFTYQNTFAAPQLSSCPSCVIIPPDQIEFYKKNVSLSIWTYNLLYDHDSIVTVNGHSKLPNRE